MESEHAGAHREGGRSEEEVDLEREREHYNGGEMYKSTCTSASLLTGEGKKEELQQGLQKVNDRITELITKLIHEGHSKESIIASGFDANIYKKVAKKLKQEKREERKRKREEKHFFPKGHHEDDEEDDDCEKRTKNRDNNLNKNQSK